MILSLERNETGARDARGLAPTCFEGHAGVLPRVHNKRRHFDLRQQGGHVCLAVGGQIASGVGGRSRDSLQLVKPVGLFLGAARNERRSEQLPKCWIFLDPTHTHQSQHGFAGLLLSLGPGAFFPTDRVAS